MNYRKIVFIAVFCLAFVFASVITPITSAKQAYTNDKWDADGNSYPDEGIIVNGHYRCLYAYDAYGKWYLEKGDGRTKGNVDSIEDLDQETLTACRNSVNYRGEFGNDRYMDSGWAHQHVNCKGYGERSSSNYIIVHETDPRYEGYPDWAVWNSLGNWEYAVYTTSGQGNLVRAGG